MVDRINAVYKDDNDVPWVVKNVAAYLTKFGFLQYNPATDGELDELPPGWEMRRVNMVYVSEDGKHVRRKIFPVGDPSHNLWNAMATVEVKGPGLDADGNEVDEVSLIYSVSSTRGEFRSFILETDPGDKGLVLNDNITEVKLAEPE